MLVTDVGDEMCLWQLSDVGEGFDHFGHQRNSVTNIHKSAPTLSYQHHCHRNYLLLEIKDNSPKCSRTKLIWVRFDLSAIAENWLTIVDTSNPSACGWNKSIMLNWNEAFYSWYMGTPGSRLAVFLLPLFAVEMSKSVQGSRFARIPEGIPETNG